MRKIFYKSDDIYLDEGVLFGKGVFETILIKEKPLFFQEHIDRLNNSIKILRLGDEVKAEVLLDTINEHNLFQCVIKVVVTIRNIIIIKRDNTYSEKDYENGFKLKISTIIRNSTSPLTYIKSINYMDNLMENIKCKEEGYNEVIFLNEKGYLTEGSTSNIFIVRDKEIYTPCIKCGLLNGTIRKYVINNFNCTEKKISLEELLQADEVFITNSLLGVMKISYLEGKCLDKYKVTNKVSEKYFNFINLKGESVNDR